jgi:hypothetical protein
MTTQEAAQEAIEKWAASKHLKFSDKNAHLLGVWIKANGLQFTVENLERALLDPHFKFSLEFESGFEPKENPAAPAVPARPKGSKFDQMIDAGIKPFRASGSTHAEILADKASREKEAEARRQMEMARQKEVEQARLRHAEENVTIFHDSGPRAGQRNHAGTEAARQAARQKYAKQDNSRPIVPAEIPAGTTDFRPFSAEQIRRYLQRETNRYAAKNK